MRKGTHKTKDGRTAKKGLYYYMNRAKKRGTSKPGKGTVTDKALRDSAKTAKKGMGGTAMKKEMMYEDGGLKKPSANQKGLKMLPEKVRNKMGYMKDGGLKMVKDPKTGKMVPFYAADGKGKMGMGGKKKMYGGMDKKKKMYGGKKKMKGGGTKKMMYETGGFLEPGIPNLDDCCN